MKPIDYYNISLECSDIEEFKKKCLEGYEFVTMNNLQEEWFDNRDVVMTVERAIELSHRCEGRIEFKAKYSRAHSLLKAHKMLSTLTWLKKLPPNTKWTKDSVLEVMSHYDSLYEFRINESAAYCAAVNMKLTKDYPWKETKIPSKPRKWTKQDILDLIAENNFVYKSDLRKVWPAYQAALNMGIINEIGLKNHERKWTPEKIFEIAKRYNNRTEFHDNEGPAYEAARSMGILQDVMAHMPIYHVDEYNRNQLYLIYLYADEENKVGYVGLTKDLKQRHKQHKSKTYKDNQYDCVASYFMSIGKPVPEPHILYSDLCPEDASRMEIKAYHDYVTNGWTMLNKQKELGDLGGHVRKWSLELIKDLIASSNIEYLNDFLKTYPDAYQSARANGWLKDLDLKYINKPKGYWTKERIIETMNSFDSLVEFSSTLPGVYNAAIRMGIDMSHLKTRTTLPKNYWTEERVIQAAESCNTLSEFRKIKRAYTIALETGLIDSFTWLTKTFNYYTEEEAIEEAKKYKSWTEFRNNNRSVCDWCKRRNMEFPWFPPRKERKPRTSKKENEEEDD